MKRKWLWFLVLPILLFGAVWWAQKVRSHRIEKELRAAMRKQSHPRYGGIAMVGKGAAVINGFANMSNPDVKAIVAEMRLTKPSASLALSSRQLQIFLAMEFMTLNITLSDDHNAQSCRGKAGKDGLIAKSAQYFDLTPESCRAVKEQVFARWGKEIAAYDRANTP